MFIAFRANARVRAGTQFVLYICCSAGTLGRDRSACQDRQFHRVNSSNSLGLHSSIKGKQLRSEHVPTPQVVQLREGWRTNGGTRPTFFPLVAGDIIFGARYSIFLPRADTSFRRCRRPVNTWMHTFKGKPGDLFADYRAVRSMQSAEVFPDTCLTKSACFHMLLLELPSVFNTCCSILGFGRKWQHISVLYGSRLEIPVVQGALFPVFHLLFGVPMKKASCLVTLSSLILLKLLFEPGWFQNDQLQKKGLPSFDPFIPPNGLPFSLPTLGQSARPCFWWLSTSALARRCEKRPANRFGLVVWGYKNQCQIPKPPNQIAN